MQHTSVQDHESLNRLNSKLERFDHKMDACFARKSNQIIALLILWLFLFLMAWKTVPVMTVPLTVPDEFGTLANAAHMAGMDWTKATDILGCYYSYGSSLFSFWAFLLFDSVTVAYRAILTVHCLMASSCLFLFYGILRQMFRSLSPGKAIAIAFAGACYPSLMIFSNRVFSEISLYFTFSLLFLLLLTALQKKSLLCTAACAVLNILLIMIHMRTVGTAAVVALAFLLMWKSKSVSGRQLLVFLLTSAAMAVIWFVLYRYFKNALWPGIYGITQSVNDVSSVFDNLSEFFTLPMLRNCLFTFTGQLFATFTATYLLGGAAMLRICGEIRKFFKEKRLPQGTEWIPVLLLAGFAAQILISSVFLIHFRRPDHLFYVRYVEYISPLLIMYALYSMFQKPLTRKELVRLSVVYIALSVCTICAVNFLPLEVNAASVSPIAAFYYDYHLGGLPYIILKAAFIFLFFCLLTGMKEMQTLFRSVSYLSVCIMWLLASQCFTHGYLLKSNAIARERVSILEDYRCVSEETPVFTMDYGLYSGKNMNITEKDDIILMAHMTYLTRGDLIICDFSELTEENHYVLAVYTPYNSILLEEQGYTLLENKDLYGLWERPAPAD